MSHLLALLLSLPPALVLTAALVLPAVEASALVGLVVPGETAVFLAGVTAHGGGLPLWSVVAAAAVGAVLGDQVGFRLGRRFGPRLLDRVPGRRSGERVEAVGRLLRRHGTWAVVGGRWTASLRALVPGLAGASGMGSGRFALGNLVGGVTWAGVVALLGFGAGAAYLRVLATLDRAGEVGLAAAVVLAGAAWLWHRRRRARATRLGGERSAASG